MTPSGITHRQNDLLFVIAQNGALAPGDLPYHLPGRSVEAYRAACARLERRGLLSAVYTGTGRRERLYEVTDKGMRVIG